MENQLNMNADEIIYILETFDLAGKFEDQVEETFKERFKNENN